MKIKQMIIILFIFLSAIPMFFLGIANMVYYNQKLEEVVENDLRIAVSTQVKAIENFFNERKTDAAVITQYQIVYELLEKANKGNWEAAQQYRTAVEDLLNARILKSNFVESVTIIDKDFVIAACSENTMQGEVSVLKDTNSEYLSPELKFTNVVETNNEGRRQKVIAAIQEIYNGENLMGYIVLEINLAFFEDIRNSANLFNNGTIYLLDGNRQMIAAGDSISSREQYELSDDERRDYQRAWAKRDPNSKDGILRYSARGAHYMSYYSNFEHTDWTIISSINVDEILQTKGSFQRLLLIIVAVLIILLITANFLITKNIAVPIESMIQKFVKIKETQDYSIRMNYNDNTEIGYVSKEINSLLASIENYLLMEKKEQERLKDRAAKDPLTGLFNKDTMESLLHLELDGMIIEQKPIAFLFLDIDDFKSFNTNHGHIGGDKVLKFIADTLQEYIPGPAGRQGGDEFIAFFSGEKEIKDLDTILNRLLETLNKGVVLEDRQKEVPIYCSIGAAVVKSNVISFDELVARADEAMYKVKENHKNGYLVWNDSLQKKE